MLNLRRKSKKVMSMAPSLERISSNKKSTVTLIIEEQDYQTRVLNESAVMDAYLRDLSSHCT